MSENLIRIGNCSGFYGDKLSAAKEMVEGGPLDVLTGDYLAELTMAILYSQKIKKGPKAGYVGTFLKQLTEIADICAKKNIKIVTNAGGLNPESMTEEAQKILEGLGLNLNIAYITGDDLLPRIDTLVNEGEKFINLDTQEPFSNQNITTLSANAYLGCWGIKKALDEGADIVICPRVTDAAVVMGPAAWKFNWQPDQYDQLAGALAAGHIIECGAQATGGNYSFFKEVPSFRNIGYPIAEIKEDGSFYITKHPNTGGLVSAGTVTAQLLYEISSPKYLNPDVAAHFDKLSIEEIAENKVYVANHFGSPPPNTLKVCMNNAGGFKNTMELIITGLDIEEKAKIFTDELVESLGGEELYDDISIQLIRTDKPDAQTNEEAMATLKISVKSQDPVLAGRLFSAKVVELGLANYPGWTVQSDINSGSPFIEYWPTSIQRQRVQEIVHINGKSLKIEQAQHESEQNIEADDFEVMTIDGDLSEIQLGRIYGTRSGDKGGCANLGVWAKDMESFNYLYSYLTVDKFKELLPDLAQYHIERFHLPNIFSLNFFIRGILGNGVSSNDRRDGQAKSLGEYLGSKTINCPKHIVQKYHANR